MENLYDLLFELSNEDRHRIMFLLKEKAMNVTNLSKKLDLTKQEVSRHLSRLCKSELTQKNIDGTYNLTHYGKLTLRQLPGLNFISQHIDYFNTHSVVHLPKEYVDRIGDFEHTNVVRTVVDAFCNIDKLVEEAQKYIWTFTDQYLVSRSVTKLFTQAYKNKVGVRNIEVRDSFVPSRQFDWYDSEDREVRRIARSTKVLAERFTDHLDLSLYMSEKEVALVSFPLLDGGFDYIGFSTTDKSAHKWCEDLFKYYWEKAIPREIVVEELHNWIKKTPESINVLQNIAKGKTIIHGKELLPELEKKRLTKQGKITLLGLLINQKHTIGQVQGLAGGIPN